MPFRHCLEEMHLQLYNFFNEIISAMMEKDDLTGRNDVCQGASNFLKNLKLPRDFGPLFQRLHDTPLMVSPPAENAGRAEHKPV